jgi:hypothetical protein
VERQEQASVGWGSGGAGAGAARGAKRGGAGQWVLSTWPVRAAGHRAERKQSRGTGGRRRGT